MNETTITITITEEDLNTLKLIPKSADRSGVITHIITLVEDKLKFKPTEIQKIIIDGLSKMNDVPLKFFNPEYFGEIKILEEKNIISIIENNDKIKILHLL